ncbi:MAG: Cysteine desulfurase [uncultured Frankineae bacterium]|uniref:Cysteine desulfurase n=1 Tax=uncultured Frankineae bacterium TaxID=437475 RepID=A0A6J4L9T2_9ACTN|nr:MAG: Cysteine desulfurase [uncultured Frankineae bacterium]
MTRTAPPAGPVVPLDVRAVRADFPALAEGLAHFDGPGGTQVPAAVSDAVAATMRSAVSNRHGPFPSSRRADAVVDAARDAVADLVGGDPGGVVLGQSMTANTYVMAGALSRTWRTGDEIVLSRLDHDADVRPWVQAAARAGAVVRWADVDLETTELPAGQYDELVTERTRLVALTAASNATGTRPDVRAIADRAHAVGAVVHVDGVHATPHLATDVRELGADLYATSAYKWYGPHVGCTVGDPALLETLRPDKLLPSSDAVPDRFEHGTPSFAAYAGVAAAVDWIASHGSGDTRRARVLSAMAAIRAHEERLFARLLEGLTARDDVTLVGAPARRTPTVAFTVAGRTPQQVSAALGERGVCVWAGNYYAVELMTALGLEQAGGAVRAGVVCYTDDEDVDRLLAGL